jgi:hypothetical protein
MDLLANVYLFTRQKCLIFFEQNSNIPAIVAKAKQKSFERITAIQEQSL